MAVRMAVRFGSFPSRVCMLMVLVVDMQVLMLHLLVQMLQFDVIPRRP